MQTYCPVIGAFLMAWCLLLVFVTHSVIWQVSFDPSLAFYRFHIWNYAAISDMNAYGGTCITYVKVDWVHFVIAIFIIIIIINCSLILIFIWLRDWKVIWFILGISKIVIFIQFVNNLYVRLKYFSFFNNFLIKSILYWQL